MSPHPHMRTYSHLMVSGSHQEFSLRIGTLVGQPSSSGWFHTCDYIKQHKLDSACYQEEKEDDTILGRVGMGDRWQELMEE